MLKLVKTYLDLFLNEKKNFLYEADRQNKLQIHAFWGFIIHTKQKSSLLSQQATEINISKVETDIQIIK